MDRKEENRKLTGAEQRRMQRFEEVSARLAGQGYRAKELTIGVVRANVLTLVVGLPVCAIVIAAYVLAGHTFSILEILKEGSLWKPLLFVVLMIVLTVAHEGVHGLTWGMFAKNRFSDIEFGFIKEYLTPYCTCKSPLSKGQYILGALMPLFVVGLLPAIVAIANGSTMLLLLGLIMILGAGGDVLVVLQLLRHGSSGKEALYYDHPTKAGLVVFER